ncbi:MAG: hypothetical protein JSR59_24200 [Proteobacteria bacterium]|nr:hypothetical protein [Pseudomonadota bacterium]
MQQYLGGAANGAPQGDVASHYDQAARNVSPDVLQEGLSALLRSDATPAFGQIAGQLFGQADANQQAGMLNQLIAGMGPAALGSLLNGAGGAGLAGILGRLAGGGNTAALSPDQASALTPDQVQVIADHAEQHDPGIVDRMSAFYAEHPTLVKTLGGAALSIALAKMAERQGG